MKTRMTAIILALCLCTALLSGCGGSSSTAVNYEPAVPAENITNSANPNPQVMMQDGTEPEQQEAADKELEATDPLTTVVWTENYTFTSLEGKIESKQFNNGVAWATLYNTETREQVVGVINRNGELLYKLDKSRLSALSDDKYTVIATPFINGLSAVYLYVSWNIGHASEPGFIIVNSEGQEVYTCLDENMFMCGQTTDGKFIVTRHDSGFSGDNWHFCILDESLEIKETGIEGSAIGQGTNPQFDLIADGMYYYSTGNSILNLNNNSWYDIKAPVYYEGNNGEVAFMYYLEDGMLGTIPLSLLNHVASFSELVQIVASDSCTKLRKMTHEVGTDEYKLKTWNDGSFLHTTYSGTPLEYADIHGNKLLGFPTFPDGVYYRRVDDFSGGYCALYLIGVDEKPYVTVIDENGTVQYDPVRVRGFGKYTSSDQIDAGSLNGYVFLFNNSENEIVIVGPDGQSLKLGDDFSSLDGFRYCINDKFSLAIGDGFMYVDTLDGKPCYYSLDGKATITSIIAKYNERGQLLYTSQSGALVYNNASVGEQAMPEIASSTVTKTYTNLSSFNIDGKWKNVGTYTFGQVQDGAIVVFDGTYCNMYSPRDTYALYKDGDSYRLDTTSLLGEPTSFTVKIVDKDNIDVYYGSNYLELTRVG